MRLKHVLLSIVMTCWIAPLFLGAPQADRRGVTVIVVKTEAEANRLRTRIREGESFDLLAVKYSVGRTSLEGGYLGAARPEELSPELRGPLDQLETGEVSQATKAGNQYLLLRWATPDEDRWRSQYDAGFQLLQQKRYGEAAQSFSVALQEAIEFGRQDSRYARSLMGLSETYRLQKLFDKAEPLARESLAVFEQLLGSEHLGVIPSLENLAALEQARGRHADAEQIYRRILSTRWSGPPGPERVDAVELLDDLAAVLSAGYFRDAQLDEAFSKFDQAVARAPLREDLYAGIRDGLLRVDLIMEAEAVMQRAVLAYPDSRIVRYGLAEMYAKEGKVEKAAEAFEQASRLESALDPDADRQQLSVIQESIGRMDSFLVRFDDALAAYKNSLELDPGNIKSRVGLADLYFRWGRLEEALPEYTRVIREDPRNATAYLGTAEVQLSRGRFSDSARAAASALTLDPEERRARYVQATALIRAGDAARGQKALQEYEATEEAALAEEKQRREILELNRSAVAKLIEGQHEQAIGLFRKALDSHPGREDEIRILLNLGLAQAKLGLHREAVETFQSMIDRGIDDFLIHRNLAVEYALLGDPRSVEQRAVYLQKYDAALKARLK